MKSRNVTRSLLGPAAALCALATAALAAEGLDPNAPLPVDPNVRMAVLPNGMRCWLRAHKTPPERVGIWLHVGTGSLNEAENQRGLAHFLEHLAFNGSEHFPPGELVKYFESIGLTFGQHQNAFTSYRHTVYVLTLPNTEEGTLRSGLLCMADFAHRMSLLPEEIEKERKVVLEEIRARKGPGQRVWEKLLPILLPGSRVAERRPIGKEEVVAKLVREDFLDYYGTWYRPGNSALLVVGDVEPEAMLKLVEEAFADWEPVADPRADAPAAVQPYREPRAAVITDPELTRTEVSAVAIRALEKVQTVGDFRRTLVDRLALWAADRRLNDMVREGKVPFQNADFWKDPLLNVCTYLGAEVYGPPDRWQAMAESLLTELKRAREHGLLAREIADARKALLAGMEQAARTESTRNARAVLADLNNVLSRGRKPMSAAQRLELAQALLPTISDEEVSAALRESLRPDARLLLVTMPQKEGLAVADREAVLALANRVEAREVAALEASERPDSLLEREPTAGTVVARDEDVDLGVLSVTLDNGVRAHLRSMDFKKDQVFVKITLGDGAIRETAENRGVTSVAALAFQRPASARLSSTDVRAIMTGKKVSVTGGAGRDYMWLSIAGAPDDLAEGMRLAHLLLTEPLVEGPALKVWQERMSQDIEKRRSNVEAQMAEHFTALLSGSDPRLQPLTQEQVGRLTKESGQRWLERIVASAPIEVAVVGDMPREEALDLVLKYLGSLPARPRKDAEIEELRRVKQNTGPLTQTVRVETITPRAVVRTGWRGADWAATKERRTLAIAAQMLRARLRKEIREDRGLTYTSFCFTRPGIAYHGMGFLAAQFTADPEKAAEAADIARDVVERFAREGPTDEEMEVTRKQFRNIIETSQKEPSYWTEVMCDMDLHGTVLEEVKNALGDYTSYTREDIMATLKRHVRDDRHVQVTALPAGEADAETRQDGAGN